MSARDVLALSPEGAAKRLASVAGCEQFSALGPWRALVVDLDGCEPALPQGPLGARVRTALQRLACPSFAIGVTPDGEAPSESWPGAVDVALGSERELEAVLEGVRRNPLASLALVQLLRHNEGVSPHEGLIAESLVYSVLQAGPEFARWRAGHPLSRGEREWSPRRPCVRVERAGEVLTLCLDRPERHNAFSTAMRDALVEALQLAAEDESVRALRLRGEGPSFCSGGDLDEFGSFPDPATAHAVRSTRNAGRLLIDLAPRTHSIVHGACIGAGIELPAFGQQLSAREGAFFQLPELAMGLVPGAGGSVSLPRRIGRRRTAWMALSGEKVSLDRALAWGLVDERLDTVAP